MHLHREFLSLSLIIVAFAASSNVVAAASNSDRHLRGSSGGGDANFVAELPSDLANYVLVDNDERELKQGGSELGQGKGQGQGNGRTSATTTTTTPTTAQLADGCNAVPSDVVCVEIYEPVKCGPNSCEYSNQCQADAAGYSSDQCGAHNKK